MNRVAWMPEDLRPDLLAVRASLGMVVSTNGATATVRLSVSSGGGVAEYDFPGVGIGALSPDDTVLVVFLSGDPGSGVVVGALTASV